MAITGNKREGKEFTPSPKYIGLFKGEVVAVNPDRDTLNHLKGLESSDSSEELKYIKTTKDDEEQANVTFWLEVEGKPGLLIPYTISLINKIKRNKQGDKIQLVNSVGDDAWVEADDQNQYDESKLFDNFKHFTKVNEWEMPNGDRSEKYQKGAKPVKESIEFLGDKEFRPALVGEHQLLQFMKTWLAAGTGQIDLKEPGANLLLDTSKLFAEDFRELQLIDSDFARPFVGLAFVTVDDEDTDKVYQKVFREFLPANFMKFINNNNSFPSKFSQNVWEKFVGEVEGEYGPNGFYVLEPLKEYDPNQDVASSKTTKKDTEAPEYKSSPKY